MRIALTGNPNSGKTTMFNALTGSNEKVGNWAGVTVDKKEHAIKKAFYSGEEQLIPLIAICDHISILCENCLGQHTDHTGNGHKYRHSTENKISLFQYQRGK